jgi:hypothetical protein
MTIYKLEFAWDTDCTEVMLLSGNDAKPAHKMYRNLRFKDNQRLGFIMFRQGE